MQFRLDRINKINTYFIAEMGERKKMNKILGKYTAIFDYVCKTLLVMSATSGNVSVALFATVIVAPVGTTMSNQILMFSVSNAIRKELLKSMKKKENTTKLFYY